VASSGNNKPERVWDYSPAPESQDHIRLAPRYDLFIDGAFRKPSGRSYVDSENPATLEKLAGVAQVPKTQTGQSGPPEPLMRSAGASFPPGNGASIFSGSPV
jgi:hypothetical protein